MRRVCHSRAYPVRPRPRHPASGAGVAGVGADHVHHELVEDIEHLCVILTQDTALEAQEQREVVAELGGDVDIGQDFDGGRQVGQVDAAGTGHHVG